MMRFPRSITIGVLGVFGVAGLAACGAGDSAASAAVERIEVPETISAGDHLGVVVTGAGDGPVELDVIDAFATSTFELSLVDGAVAFDVPEQLTTLSGGVQFRARGADASAASASTKILPAGDATRIDVHVGPRSVVADGADQTMGVAIAADLFGNPVAEDSPIEFTTVDADGTIAVAARVAVENGLAVHLLSTDTVAGSVDVFATAESSVASQRVGYDEVPGLAADVALTPPAAEAAWLADGRTVHEVRTEPIADGFGNLLPDGHLVRLAVEGPDGSGRLTAKTIGGIARFDVVAPARPGAITLVLSVDGAVSDLLELEALAAISRMPVSVSSDGGTFDVRVGPVLDAAGAVVVDGTAVSANLDDERVDSLLFGGVATISLDDSGGASGSALAVEVLGVIERLELP